jgi:LysM repeat protein
MRRLASVAMVFIGTLTACNGVITPNEPGMAMKSQVRFDAALANAKLESASLRAELAAARIVVAKTHVEIEALQRELAQARQSLTEMNQVKGELHSIDELRKRELAMQKQEAEQWLKEKTEMQRELLQMPELRTALAAARLSEQQNQARIKELELAVIPVAASPRSKAQTAGAKSSRNRQAVEAGSMPVISALSQAKEDASIFVSSLSGTPAVTVQQGDTLWSLAQQHRMTVQQLKSANLLMTDLIRPGQRLYLSGDH